MLQQTVINFVSDEKITIMALDPLPVKFPIASLSFGIEIRPLSAHTALPPFRTGLPPR